ncbi:hypothetical protein [Streptomyces sp. NPDC088847]|uniref:hypothetical protein n=1 Tax=Streptomyces sp. NPDC088847 TaxID=3365909 RepID=UPI00382EB710
MAAANQAGPSLRGDALTTVSRSFGRAQSSRYAEAKCFMVFGTHEGLLTDPGEIAQNGPEE